MKIIHSVFPTIQGEGKNIGKNLILIRFYGCNLHCSFCDTKYASQKKIHKSDDIILAFEKSKKFLHDILERWKNTYPEIDTILLTGGEPLYVLTQYLPLTYVFSELSEIFVKYGYVNLEIETNGYIFNKFIETYFEKVSEFHIHKKGIVNVQFNISPKKQFLVDKSSYNKWLNLYGFEYCTHKLGINYVIKPIYIENDNYLKHVLNFVNEFKIPKDKVFMMPFTPIELKNDKKKFFYRYRQNGYKTIKFCLQHGFRYTPRLHIEMMFNEVNELGDIVF